MDAKLFPILLRLTKPTYHFSMYGRCSNSLPLVLRQSLIRFKMFSIALCMTSIGMLLNAANTVFQGPFSFLNPNKKKTINRCKVWRSSGPTKSLWKRWRYACRCNEPLNIIGSVSLSPNIHTIHWVTILFDASPSTYCNDFQSLRSATLSC